MNEKTACVSKYPLLDKIKNQSVVDWLYDWIGGEWGGNTDVPLSHESINFNSRDVEHVVMFLNDSSEIGFGYPDEWHTIIERKSFNKVIRWYLWKWAVFEWFGLRRWIWYKLLHMKCKKYESFKE